MTIHNVVSVVLTTFVPPNLLLEIRNWTKICQWVSVLEWRVYRKVPTQLAWSAALLDGELWCLQAAKRWNGTFFVIFLSWECSVSLFSVSEVVNSYLCCTKIEFFFHRKGPTPEVLQEASVGISESAVVNCESCCLFVLRGFMLASFKGWLALRLTAFFFKEIGFKDWRTTICESRRINSPVNFYNMGWHKEFQSSVVEQFLLWQNQTSLISRSISWTIAPAAVIMLRHQRTSPLPWFALPESRKVELLTHAKELSLEKSPQRQLNDFWFEGDLRWICTYFEIPTFLWFSNLYVALLYHAS